MPRFFSSPELTGLSPGQTAQIEWYVNTSVIQAGRTLPASGYHAFLIGRRATGTWFLSDQGNQPPLVLQAANLLTLQADLNTAAASGRSWLDTHPATRRRLLTWTGVRVFGRPESIDARHRRLIAPGQPLGQINPGIRSNIAMVTWDWVGVAASLGGARNLFPGSGRGHGFLVAEMPATVFNVAKTNPVPDHALDGRLIPGGLLAQSPPAFVHAWLQLANANQSRLDPLSVY